MLQRQALLNANPLLHGLEANLPLLDCILIPTKMEIFVNGKRRIVWATPHLFPHSLGTCRFHQKLLDSQDQNLMECRTHRSSIDSGYSSAVSEASATEYPTLSASSPKRLHFTTPIDQEGFKVHLAGLGLRNTHNDLLEDH